MKSNYNPLQCTVANSAKRQTSLTDKVTLWEGQIEAETQSNDRDESDNDILQEGSQKEKSHTVVCDKKKAYYAAQSVLIPKKVNVQEFAESNKNKNEENLREKNGDLNDNEIANENNSEGTSPKQKHQKLTERDKRTINTAINTEQEKSCDFLAKNRRKNHLDKTQFNNAQSKKRVETETVTEASDKSPLNGTTVTDHSQDISDLNITYTLNTIDLHSSNASIDNEEVNEIGKDDPPKTESGGISSKDSKSKYKQKKRVKEAQSKKNFGNYEKGENLHIKGDRTNEKKKTVKISTSRKLATKLHEVANTPKEGSGTGETNGVKENLRQNLTSEKEKGGQGSKSQKKREILSEMSNIDTKQRRNEVQPSHEQSVSKIPRKKRKIKILEADDKKQSNKLGESISEGIDDRQKENRKGNNDTNKNVQKDEYRKKKEDEVEQKPTRSSARAAAKAASVKISETAYSDLSSPKRKRGRPRKK